MELQSFRVNFPQFSPTVQPLRTLPPLGFVPRPEVVPSVTNAVAAEISPGQALRGWIRDYSTPGNRDLFEQVAADTSGQGTLFRRGLMAESLVVLP